MKGSNNPIPPNATQFLHAGPWLQAFRQENAQFARFDRERAGNLNS